MGVLDRLFPLRNPPPQPIQKAEEIKSAYSWHSHSKNCECPVCIFHEQEKKQFYKAQQPPRQQVQQPPPQIRQEEQIDYSDIPSYVKMPPSPQYSEPIDEPPVLIKQHKQKIAEPQDSQNDIMRDHLVADLNNRVKELERLHPELLPKKPTPASKTLLKWLFFCVLVGGFLYGIYLFYLSTLGYTVRLPF